MTGDGEKLGNKSGRSSLFTVNACQCHGASLRSCYDQLQALKLIMHALYSFPLVSPNGGLTLPPLAIDIKSNQAWRLPTFGKPFASSGRKIRVRRSTESYGKTQNKPRRLARATNRLPFARILMLSAKPFANP